MSKKYFIKNTICKDFAMSPYAVFLFASAKEKIVFSLYGKSNSLEEPDVTVFP
jgi:hypothetical protein